MVEADYQKALAEDNLRVRITGHSLPNLNRWRYAMIGGEERILIGCEW